MLVSKIAAGLRNLIQIVKASCSSSTTREQQRARRVATRTPNWRYDWWCGGARGVMRRLRNAALSKFGFQSNQAADEAVTRLSRAELHGVCISVKRALYWGESWPATPQPMQQHPRPALDWWQVRVVPAAEVACSKRALQM